MNAVDGLECRRCGRRFAPGEVEYTCPDHDGVSGVLDVQYAYDEIRDRFDPAPGSGVSSLWEFESLLPVEPGDEVSLGAGGTPLLTAPSLSESVDATVRIKDETGNPTGSNKDRGTAVVVTRARQLGRGVVTCASTGNAAASLAGYAARAGLDCRLFVPADVPDAKAVQPRLYGADVVAVDGSYADAYERCRRASTERGWYNRSAAVNPYAVEGNRTLGFELALQAAGADWVAMPMGNGCSLAGAWKGVAEFEELGVTDDTPRFLGVQAAGATAIRDRFTGRSGSDRRDAERSMSTSPDAGGTVADSIDVRSPHNAHRACDAIAESGGDVVVVDDDRILRAQRLLGEREGVFVEPASAAAVAGVELARANGTVASDDDVVVVATGSGLKDTAAARRSLGDGSVVEASPGESDADR